jgi:hypothetical protein
MVMDWDDEPDAPPPIELTPIIEAPGLDGWDEAEVTRFFEEYANHKGPTNIGLSLGWSPAKIKRFLAIPAFTEILTALGEREIETVEHAVYMAARRGNMVAAKLYLFNRAPHHGWADRRNITIQAHSQQEIVVSVRQALEETTRAKIEAHGIDGVLALQMMAEDDDIVDAELVE